jgi:hypothetical protein
MKMKLAVALASVVCLALAGSVLADDAGKKPIVMKDKIKLEGTVTAIDKPGRQVTILGSKGNILVLTVDESVKRFDAMKVGDKITAEYYESVSYDIKKPGTAAKPDTVTEAAGKLSGAKPGGGVATSNVTTVTVLKIDTAAPSVTIRGSDGQVQTIAVRHPEYLKEVKVGDVVVVTKTEALMVAVE